MFERLNERACMTVVRVKEEAEWLGHDYIGTEHLLLALLREEDGDAARALTSLGVGWTDVRRQVEIIAGFGEGGGECLPLTPLAKEALELGVVEMPETKLGRAGTEQDMLGIFHVKRSVAVCVLSDLNVGRNEARRALARAIQERGGSGVSRGNETGGAYV